MRGGSCGEGRDKKGGIPERALSTWIYIHLEPSSRRKNHTSRPPRGWDEANERTATNNHHMYAYIHTCT